MKIIFTDFPFSKVDHFVYGIEDEKSLEEFQSIFGISSFENNIVCELPSGDLLLKLLPNIKSQELKNVLQQYSGKKILIIPEKEDYFLRDKMHYAKIQSLIA